MSNQEEFLTVDETGHELRVTPLTLKNWRDRGEGPPWVRIGPKTIRYRRSTLFAYLDELESKSISVEEG